MPEYWIVDLEARLGARERNLTVELTCTTGSTFIWAIVTQRRPLPMAG
jgi:hypothetical protein